MHTHTPQAAAHPLPPKRLPTHAHATYVPIEQVQVKPLGIYLGFSARESWRVPDGEGANRGDTLVMVALKCRKQDEAVFLLG